MQFKTETKVGIFILFALAALIYMVFYLGLFKINLSKYNSYNIYFNDISGITRKSDVKISGIKVGWVDKVNLVDSGTRARIKIFINKNFTLYADASAQVKQEGLLGSKYLEVHPGSANKEPLVNNSTLYMQGSSIISIDDILIKIKTITDNIELISESLVKATGLDDQRNELKNIVQNISQTTKKISDLDFNKVINEIDKLTMQLNSITQKVNNGEGFVGKIINETAVYDDIKTVASALRTTVDIANNAELIVDSHWESMFRPAEFFPFDDSKGYFEMRLHTSEDKFYLFQLLSSLKGNLYRDTSYFAYSDANGKILSERELYSLPPAFAIQPPRVEVLSRRPDSFKFGLQFGKIFGNIALRFGLIENFAGTAIDYEIPLKSKNFRWVSTFEAFDFRGQDRIDDRRPHFKWINRMFLLRNIYLVFGADDFVSRRNANAFFGGGLRFNDDDLKILFSSVGFFAGFMK